MAVEIPSVSLPFYGWLDDDIHSERDNHSTVFPDGCGMGATWSRQGARLMASVAGSEARAVHNALVHTGQRGEGITNDGGGTGITAVCVNAGYHLHPMSAQSAGGQRCPSSQTLHNVTSCGRYHEAVQLVKQSSCRQYLLRLNPSEDGYAMCICLRYQLTEFTV